MAELLVAEGWAEPESLGVYLGDALPEGYYILASPTVQGCALDAVVVGPQGLFVLYARNWEGEVRPARFGSWAGQLPSGREVRYPNPMEEAHNAARALRAFLRDEFPSLRPMIWHFLVLMNPDVQLAASEATEARAITADDVVEEIASAEPPPYRTTLDDDVRQQLALALRDRRLTASQRASAPFTFRSGGLLGSGKKVWTIREAVRHMSRHPQDGVYHLRNGTLAQWLSDQGAEHLAVLAREVMSQGEADSRIVLERFLVGTGLAHRPPLSVRPRELNLGFILSGESAARRLRVAKGWGRGYLFGTLQPSESWLDVEPREMSGTSDSVVSVSARTEGLFISPTPYEAEILIHSNASEEPVAVPVRLRVMGMPSRFNRRVLRPLAGFLSAGLLGALMGWLLGLGGAPSLGSLPALASRSMSPAAGWAVVVGLAWALLGALRGLRQRFAWPTSFALQRWLLRTLAWVVALWLIATAGLWCWDLLHPQPTIAASTAWTISVGALALGILPAVLEEVSTSRSAERKPVETAREALRRPLLAAAIGLALVLLVALGVPALGLARDRYDLDDKATSAQEWAGDQSEQFETGINDFIDRIYLRYYDRRAPKGATPTAPVSTPSPAPTEGSP